RTDSWYIRKYHFEFIYASYVRRSLPVDTATVQEAHDNSKYAPAQKLRIVPPYPLTLTVEELISPSFNSRRASQYRRNPATSRPPRPYYFEILAKAAREKHNELYPEYKYSPKRKNKSKKASK
ncbi:18404_t:CDS:2, partial [Racocetra persica]